ncbi:MAG: hypothetical protein WC596_03885 [Candidatus Shapirobacteria bacterium]
MILIYAFSNPWGTNISRRVLLELQKQLSLPFLKGRSPDETLVDIGKRDFALIHGHPRPFFQTHIEHKIYSIIIGLGDGSKFISKIKIETRAKNVYLDKEIYPFSPIFLDLNLPVVDNFDSDYFQIGSNMGTYNCNYMAYQTQLHLNQKSPQTKHLFLHLPQKSNATDLASRILCLFQDNQVLNKP